MCTLRRETARCREPSTATHVIQCIVRRNNIDAVLDSLGLRRGHLQELDILLELEAKLLVLHLRLHGLLQLQVLHEQLLALGVDGAVALGQLGDAARVLESLQLQSLLALLDGLQLAQRGGERVLTLLQRVLQRGDDVSLVAAAAPQWPCARRAPAPGFPRCGVT